MLAELVACHDAALDAASASAGADFEALLAAAAEPLLDSIERSAEALDPNASSRSGWCNKGGGIGEGR